MKRSSALLSTLLCCAAHALPPSGPLPRSVAPVHYHLELAMDPARSDFEGEVVIEVDVRSETRRVWLHARDVEIRSARIERDGADPVMLQAQPGQSAPGGVLALDATEALATGLARLRIEFGARFDTRLEGTYVVERDGARYVMTQMQPLGARQSFPSFDEPAFKTPWDIAIRAPRDQRVIANTALLREEVLEDGWVRHVFRTSEPLPSYLVAYAVGPWDIVEHAPLPRSAHRDRELPLRGIAAAGRGGEMDYALARTRDIVEALEAWFDLPYPYDKLDILAAPDFAAGAMENAGLILYRESLLFVDADTPPDALRAFYQVHAHELAHQWFGNLVTMPWWDDLWLNEAFATWMAAKTTQALRPDLGAQRAYRARVLATMAADSLGSVRRIAEPVEDWRDIEAAFDGITYAKGGAVLQMFESWMGEDAFREGIRDYVRRHAHGNARGSELIAALAARMDQPDALGAAFRSFIRQPGVPELSFKQRCSADGAHIEVSQRRYLPLGSDASAEQLWSLPLCLRHGRGGEAGKYCTLLVAEPVQTVTLPVRAGCPDWLMPNAEGAGYFRFRLDAQGLDALAEHADQLGDAEMQVYADALDAGLRAGTVSLDAYLRATAPLAMAADPEVALAPLGLLRWLRSHVLEDGPALSVYRQLMAERHGPALRQVGAEPGEGESVAKRQLRNRLSEVLAMDAEDPRLRAELRARSRRALAADDIDGFDGLGADRRGLALRVLVEDGEPGEFHQLIERLHGSRDPRFRRDLLQSIGHARLAELRLQALELALSPAIASGELVGLLQPVFADRQGAAQARAWFDLNEDALLARLPALAQSRMPALYASALCESESADRLHERFAERMARTDGGPRALAQAVEQVRLCAALRAALLAVD